MDLKAFVQGESPHVEGRGFAGIAQGPPRKPIIAAIEGFAVAGGLEVALACDLIVAARGAKLGIPEAKRSLVAAGGALLRLPQRIPYHLAMEMALTGDPISAERGGRDRPRQPPGRARRGGRGRARARRGDRRQRPAGPRGLQAHPVEAQGDWSEDEAWQRQGEIAGPVFGSEDAREGATAFAEKRAPVWKGR